MSFVGRCARPVVGDFGSVSRSSFLSIGRSTAAASVVVGVGGSSLLPGLPFPQRTSESGGSVSSPGVPLQLLLQLSLVPKVVVSMALFGSEAILVRGGGEASQVNIRDVSGVVGECDVLAVGMDDDVDVSVSGDSSGAAVDSCRSGGHSCGGRCAARGLFSVEVATCSEQSSGAMSAPSSRVVEFVGSSHLLASQHRGEDGEEEDRVRVCVCVCVCGRSHGHLSPVSGVDASVVRSVFTTEEDVPSGAVAISGWVFPVTWYPCLCDVAPPPALYSDDPPQDASGSSGQVVLVYGPAVPTQEVTNTNGFLAEMVAKTPLPPVLGMPSKRASRADRISLPKKRWKDKRGSQDV